VGDALGANFEGQPGDSITARFPTVRHLIQNPPAGEQWYTDDTQMAIGVAETLVACGCIDEQKLCQDFAANYVPALRVRAKSARPTSVLETAWKLRCFSACFTSLSRIRPRTFRSSSK
jgi:poly(ADP-ribose) glycohydrolase ARH3